MDWDERFRLALAEPPAPDPPADWLLARSDLLAAQAPARALDVACGLGRHALLLADLGFDVDALDGSAVALDHLAEVARERRLAISTVRVDLTRGPVLPRPPYAVIVMTNHLQRDLLPALLAALAPGGLLAVEAFLAQADPEWGPRSPEFVLAPGELEALLGGAELVFVEEAPHRGRTKARVLARAPVEAVSGA